MSSADRDVERCVETDVHERAAQDNKIDDKIGSMRSQLDRLLDQTRQDRIEKLRELKAYHQYEVSKQQMIVEDFSKKVDAAKETVGEFNHVTTHTMKEVQHRLSEQDSIIDELSKVVKSIQDTLEVLGKDA